MIAETIQLSLAPVFVLVAIGNFLNVLTGRVARIVDRSRSLQTEHVATTGPEHDRVVSELRVISRRLVLVNRAILMLVLAAILTGIIVALLFLGSLTDASLVFAISAAFIGAMALFLAALIAFLKETRLATAALRIPESFLELDRRL